MVRWQRITGAGLFAGIFGGSAVVELGQGAWDAMCVYLLLALLFAVYGIVTVFKNGYHHGD